MKTTFKVLAALLVTISSSAAMAESGKFYIAGELGAGSYGIKVTSRYTNTEFAKPGVLSLSGGYHFNEYLGLEAGLSIFSESTINTSGSIGAKETLKANSVKAAVVGTLPLGQRFDLFAKLGMANTKIDYTYSSTGGIVESGSANASKTNMLVGLGGQFNINKHFGIRAQYEDLGKVTFPRATESFHVTAFSVGCVYNF